MIQAVLFDLFETLITESTVSVRRASSLARELGLDEDAYRRDLATQRNERSVPNIELACPGKRQM